MSNCALTRGRRELKCKDNIGGIKAVYLLNYIIYPFKQIQGFKSAEITKFPYAELHKFEVRNANFSEQITNDENGVSYNQSLTFTLIKQDLVTTSQLDKLQKIDLRYVVEFNDGTFRLGGALNGAKLESYTNDSGSSKASLNGYNLTFNSLEEYPAPFLRDGLDTFGGYLILENSLYILTENSERIILE